MPETPYQASRFRKALIHFISGRAAQAGARAILLLTLVRVLEINDYGAYMLVIGLAETLLQVASLGILPVGQRFLPQLLTTIPAKKLYSFVGFLIAAQLAVLALITFALFTYWNEITPSMGFSDAQTVASLVAVWLFLVIPAFRFSAEMLDALLEQGRAQIARALMPTLRVVGVVGLIVSGSEITLARVFLVDIAATALCLALAWAFLAGSLGRLHSETASGELPAKEMLVFAWHMAATGLLGACSSPGALRLVLANALGIAESGLFAFLQSLQRLVGRYLPGTLLRGLVRPILVDRFHGPRGMAILEAGSGLLLKANTIIVATGAVAIALAGNEIVTLLSGGKFSDAGLTLLLMFVALVITSQRTVIEMVMQITGHTATLRTTALIAPIGLAAVWYFAEFGLNIAVLIIALTSALSNWIAMAVLIRSTEEFELDWRGFIAVIIPALVIGALCLPLINLINPYLVAAIGVLIFLLTITFTKPLRQQEVNVIGSGAGKRISSIARRFAVS